MKMTVKSSTGDAATVVYMRNDPSNQTKQTAKLVGR